MKFRITGLLTATLGLTILSCNLLDPPTDSKDNPGNDPDQSIS